MLATTKQRSTRRTDRLPLRGNHGSFGRVSRVLVSSCTTAVYLPILHLGKAFFSRLGLVLLILRVPEARAVLFGVLRRDTDNQIKINRQFSGLRPFQGLEFFDEHVF